MDRRRTQSNRSLGMVAVCLNRISTNESIEDLTEAVDNLRRRTSEIVDRRSKKVRRKKLMRLADRLDQLYQSECMGQIASPYNAAVASLSKQLSALLRDNVK